ncbi:MAG: pyrroloquinoline-quinone synthase PqqC [Alphaproteobacteria bacterium]|nr:pyrroloquinoline-quinone synthase PqqC [Alphaproteobacteria bacterium]
MGNCVRRHGADALTSRWSASEFEERLRAIGVERYHDKHPFHIRLHTGLLSQGQMQAWVLNRFYYQKSIPLKDASLIGRADDIALRREWISRIIDHDGGDVGQGGIERWLLLAEGVGLDRAYVASCEGVLPATRFACEAYVRFVRERSLLEAVASSLTELFAPELHRTRITALLEYYPFANEVTLSYFRNRLVEAPADVAFGLSYVLDHAQSREEQELCLRALRFKTDVLWAQLDALDYAYVAPGRIPVGAFVPLDRS